MKKHLLVLAVVAGLACLNGGVANADSDQGLASAQLGYFVGVFGNRAAGAAAGAFAGAVFGVAGGPVGVILGTCLGAF